MAKKQRVKWQKVYKRWLLPDLRNSHLSMFCTYYFDYALSLSTQSLYAALYASVSATGSSVAICLSVLNASSLSL